ncbi:hypothetical protein TNIN_352171 [Trichonephila inaurata madagascariensis]|uniref:Uncharacterized protein n=1 Tax=Trichonephila inaurata madagascariensis TaxID=2747483 RepID=A0A8X7CJ75_9ARAC|nr:hypothetical protein TNIN_352171 [Trichonephila inaurata madagascariensis]
MGMMAEMQPQIELERALSRDDPNEGFTTGHKNFSSSFIRDYADILIGSDSLSERFKVISTISYLVIHQWRRKFTLKSSFSKSLPCKIQEPQETHTINTIHRRPPIPEKCPIQTYQVSYAANVMHRSITDGRSGAFLQRRVISTDLREKYIIFEIPSLASNYRPLIWSDLSFPRKLPVLLSREYTLSGTQGTSLRCYIKARLFALFILLLVVRVELSGCFGVIDIPGVIAVEKRKRGGVCVFADIWD